MSEKKCPRINVFPHGATTTMGDIDPSCIGADCALWDAETERCADLLAAQVNNRRACPDCGGAGNFPVFDDSAEDAEPVRTEDCERCGGSGMLPIVKRGDV